MIAPDAMRALARAGFGEAVPMLAGQPAGQRREIFQRFADSYDTAWRICPECVRRAAPFGGNDELKRRERDDSAAARPAAKALRIAGRVLLGVLACVLVLLAWSLYSSFPAAPPFAVNPGLRLRSASFAGLARAAALLALLAGLMLANAACRRSSGNGPVDWALCALGSTRFPLLGDTTAYSGLVGVVAAIWLAIELAVRTTIHWSPEAAAAAFAATRRALDVAVTGGIAFVADDRGIRHVAAFTPDFVRAAEALGIRFGMLARPAEFPMPGALPIVVLLVLGIAQATRLLRALLGRATHVDPPRVAAQTVLGFAIVNTYVVTWIGAVQTGILVSPAGDHVEGNLVLLAGVLILAAAIVAVMMWRWIVHPMSTLLFAGMCWANLFFILGIAAVVMVYVSGYATAGSPAKLWLLAYVLAAATCWFAAMPADREQNAAIDRAILEPAA